MHILSLILFLPIIAMTGLSLVPSRFSKAFPIVSLCTALLQLVLFLTVLTPKFQEVSEQQPAIESRHFPIYESQDWIYLQMSKASALKIDYIVGLDGLGYPMVLLSLLIMIVATISAWNIQAKPKAFFMLMLLLNTSIIGCFVSLDFFLFYLFYELMLLPMFFLIGIWGGERREYAAIKFFLYTLVGSVFLLLVMVGLAYSFTVEGSPAIHSFNMLDMTPTIDGHLPHIIKGSIFDKGQEIWGWDARKIGFLITFFAFAIKLPIVPLHTWLPDAHVEAPTAVSVILAGVLLKVGGYGIIRISYGIFPEAAIGYSGLVGILGVIAMIYGAWVAMGQKDLKAMIAYSSISHLGYCLLGLSSLTLSGYYGAVLQMFNHGLTSAILFLLVGVLYDRVHIREISLFQGLWQKMPFFTFFVIIGFFASLGLPGFNTFVSEMLVFMGAFQAGVKGELPLWMSFLAVTTIVFGAVYFLRAFRTMFMGKYPYAVHQNWDMKLIDLDTREYYLLIPLAMLLLFFGIFPHIILNMIEKSYLLWIWK